MELSLEEALDICLELIGCGVVIAILDILLHADAFAALFGRVV